MQFEEELRSRQKYVEELLDKYLPEETGYASTLIEAVNYSVRVGGKRIRPILLLETLRFFEGDILPVAEPFAVALELIHTYSLVHDDLPAMDNDALRRGKATTHKKYGEAMAILAGDALLNLSMQVASKAIWSTPDTKLAAMAVNDLYDKAGLDGMIGGQAVDVLAEKQEKKIEKAELDFIYDKKTGALIEAAMIIGTRLAKSTREKDVALVRQAAAKIGLAFQIKDDILDVEGIEEILGKPIGSDYRNGKATYVNFVGIEQAKKDVETLTDEAISLMESYKKKDDFLLKLMKYLAGRDR